ncbi:uncharacterized protein Hap1MRO34_020184 [Clarias gariepinus]
MADMVNSSCGTEQNLVNKHQAEFEEVRSGREVSIDVAEQEAVSIPAMFLSDVDQDNALCDRLQCKELSWEAADHQEIHPTLTEVLPEVKKGTKEPEEHTADIKTESQDHPDLEDTISKLLADLNEVEDIPRTTSSPEPQTSLKDRISPKPFHDCSFDVNEDRMLLQEIEETIVGPETTDDHPEMLSGTALAHLEELCFNSEMQLLANEETETLEPPAKKRLKKRMGMCGLGDRKRKFQFDGSYFRQSVIGRQRKERDGKGNTVAYNTMLEDDGTTHMNQEGTIGPSGKENEEVLKDKESEGAEEMEDKRAREKTENLYTKKNNTDKWTALMNDQYTIYESSKENKVDILEENDRSIMMEDKGIVERLVLDLKLLEEISTCVGQTLISPTTGTNLNLFQDERSVATASNEHEMDTLTCDEEPSFLGNEIPSNEQDLTFNMKHFVMSEKQNPNAKHKLRKDTADTLPDVEAAQEISRSSTLEMSEGSTVATKAAQEIPSGLEVSATMIEKQCPPDMAAAETNEPSGSTANRSDPLFLNIMDILTMASSGIHGEIDKPVTAVSESKQPDGGHVSDAKEIHRPLAPPTGQENHMDSLLDQNACDTSATLSVAAQQLCNLISTPAANELPQETDLSVPSSFYSMTDSQLQTIALSMDLDDQFPPEARTQGEDGTKLVHGLVRELSSLNRIVMAAHREMEIYRRGKNSKTTNRRSCASRQTEK